MVTRPRVHAGNGFGQGWAYPEEVKDVHGIRRYGDARAELPERPGLLEDAHRHAGMLEREGGRQAADPGADDRDRAVKVSCARLSHHSPSAPDSAGCRAQGGVHLPDQDLAGLGRIEAALSGRG